MAKTAAQKYRIVGRGFPRKFTHHIKKVWFSGTMNTKQTIELLQKLYDHKYHEVAWLLQPNRNAGQPGHAPYNLSITYWGTEGEGDTPDDAKH